MCVTWQTHFSFVRAEHAVITYVLVRLCAHDSLLVYVLLLSVYVCGRSKVSYIARREWCSTRAAAAYSTYIYCVCRIAAWNTHTHRTPGYMYIVRDDDRRVRIVTLRKCVLLSQYERGKIDKVLLVLTDHASLIYFQIFRLMNIAFYSRINIYHISHI